jgi:hypothetical protein
VVDKVAYVSNSPSWPPPFDFSGRGRNRHTFLEFHCRDSLVVGWFRMNQSAAMVYNAFDARIGTG